MLLSGLDDSSMTKIILEEIKIYLTELSITLAKLNYKEFEAFLQALVKAYKKENNIFIFGNGGSGLTASHFASDLNKGVSYGKRKRFKVIPLADNIATIMAYANDVSYEDIFVEQLKNFLTTGDIVIGISGSGNSKNVLKAITYANKKGNTTVGLTGFDGGLLKKIAKISVNANVNCMQKSEDIHLITAHLTTKVLRKMLEK